MKKSLKNGNCLKFMLHVGKNNVFVSFLPVMNPASLLQRKTPAAATSATSPIFPNIWNFAAMSSHLSRRPSRKKLSKAAATEIKKENELQVRSYCKRGSLFFCLLLFGRFGKKAPAHPPSPQVLTFRKFSNAANAKSRLMCHCMR